MNTTKQHEMIKLTHDFMFKAIFGKESNKELLAYIINKYLKLNINENNIEINNSEMTKNNIHEKKKSVDLIVTLNDNTIVNIEVNANNNWDGLIDRNTAYICKVFSEQYLVNQPYKKTKKCIQINLDTFGITENKDILVFKLMSDNIVLTPNLEIHYINLEKVREVCYDEDVKELAKIITSKDYKELEKNVLKMGKLGEKLVNEVENLSKDGYILGLYDKELEEKTIRESIRLRAFDDGFDKGKQDGFTSGFNNGFNNGVKDNTLSVAKKMLKKKISIDVISEVTGLTTKEIEKIK